MFSDVESDKFRPFPYVPLSLFSLGVLQGCTERRRRGAGFMLEFSLENAFTIVSDMLHVLHK
jgi:hypothetical protein